MRILIRGNIAHIIIKEDIPVVEVFQDMMVHPPETYGLELHLDQNSEIIGIILLDCNADHDYILRILNYFIQKYEKMDQFEPVASQLIAIVHELRKHKPMTTKNLFRFDQE